MDPETQVEKASRRGEIPLDDKITHADIAAFANEKVNLKRDDVIRNSIANRSPGCVTSFEDVHFRASLTSILREKC